MPLRNIVRFGVWELHVDSGELLSGARRVRLQDHPLQVLKALLETPGELVTRERLITRLWPSGVVDFEAGLNTAVRKLRAALGDDADTPRYIETIPKRGYRFIAPVEQADRAEPGMPADLNPGASHARRPLMIAGIYLLLLALGVIGWRVAQLHAVPDSGSSASSAPVAILHEPRTDPNVPLDAYLEYQLGRRLLATYTRRDVQAAAEHFQKALDLHPSFASAYVQLANAKVRLMHLRNEEDAHLMKEAARLATRALQLDASLGEAHAILAEATDEPAQADASYRKAIALAPDSADVFESYANFLWNQGNQTAAIEMVSRAVELDPLAPRMHHLRGTYLMFGTPDLERSRREFLAALAINPRFNPSLCRLARLEQVRGNFAEAAKLVERAIEIDPGLDWCSTRAVSIYLDLQDVAAARDVSGVSQASVHPGSIEIALFENDAERAAQLAINRMTQLGSGTTSAMYAEAIRDRALLNRNFEAAIQALQAARDLSNSDVPGRVPWSNRDDVALAQLLAAHGKTEAAEQLLRTVVARVPAQEPHRRYYPTRAAALAMLGEHRAALEELAAAAADNYTFASWWYTFERDPAFVAFRSEPQFQALNARARENAARQRSLLEEMRRRGEVPKRGSIEKTELAEASVTP